MLWMFLDASAFNGDLSLWDVSKVTYMMNMFNGAKSFNQTLCWDTAKATTTGMFDGSQGNFSLVPYPSCLPTAKPTAIPTVEQTRSPTVIPTVPHGSCPDNDCKV
jgi:surface protein